MPAGGKQSSSPSRLPHSRQPAWLLGRRDAGPATSMRYLVNHSQGVALPHCTRNAHLPHVSASPASVHCIACSRWMVARGVCSNRSTCSCCQDVLSAAACRHRCHVERRRFCDDASKVAQANSMPLAEGRESLPPRALSPQLCDGPTALRSRLNRATVNANAMEPG